MEITSIITKAVAAFEGNVARFCQVVRLQALKCVHAFWISTLRRCCKSWLHLRNEGTLVAGLQEFDKNSIRKVALRRSPCKRSRLTSSANLACPGGWCPSRPGFICHWHEVSPGEQAGPAGAVDRAEGISRPSVEPSVGSVLTGLDHRSVCGRVAAMASWDAGPIGPRLVDGGHSWSRYASIPSSAGSLLRRIYHRRRNTTCYRNETETASLTKKHLLYRISAILYKISPYWVSAVHCR